MSLVKILKEIIESQKYIYLPDEFGTWAVSNEKIKDFIWEADYRTYKYKKENISINIGDDRIKEMYDDFDRDNTAFKYHIIHILDSMYNHNLVISDINDLYNVLEHTTIVWTDTRVKDYRPLQSLTYNGIDVSFLSKDSTQKYKHTFLFISEATNYQESVDVISLYGTLMSMIYGNRGYEKFGLKDNKNIINHLSTRPKLYQYLKDYLSNDNTSEDEFPVIFSKEDNAILFDLSLVHMIMNIHSFRNTNKNDSGNKKKLNEFLKLSKLLKDEILKNASMPKFAKKSVFSKLGDFFEGDMKSFNGKYLFQVSPYFYYLRDSRLKQPQIEKIINDMKKLLFDTRSNILDINCPIINIDTPYDNLKNIDINDETFPMDKFKNQLY